MPRPRIRFVRCGDRFGRLTAVREFTLPVTAPSLLALGRTTGPWAAFCRCDCGGETTVLLDNLFKGRQISCGCYKVERAASRLADVHRAQVTHGLSKHEHYRRWYQMIKRCEDPDSKSYPNYGQRGISVADEWHDPAVFIDYLDTHLGPLPAGYTLDRIANDGNYEPGNVRWADWFTQNRNQRPRRRRQVAA
jgi:hypothetical protein